MSGQEVRGFRAELASLFNRYGVDQTYETPDFILADLVTEFLTGYGKALHQTRQWHGWPTLAESLATRTTHHITHDTEGGPHVG